MPWPTFGEALSTSGIGICCCDLDREAIPLRLCNFVVPVSLRKERPFLHDTRRAAYTEERSRLTRPLAMIAQLL